MARHVTELAKSFGGGVLRDPGAESLRDFRYQPVAELAKSFGGVVSRDPRAESLRDFRYQPVAELAKSFGGVVLRDPGAESLRDFRYQPVAELAKSFGGVVSRDPGAESLRDFRYAGIEFANLPYRCPVVRFACYWRLTMNQNPEPPTEPAPVNPREGGKGAARAMKIGFWTLVLIALIVAAVRVFAGAG